MTTEQPATRARRGIGRDGLVWAENTVDGSWSTGAGPTRQVCPSLVVLLLEHGPLNLIEGRTRAPYGLSCNQPNLPSGQQLSDSSASRRREGTAS